MPPQPHLRVERVPQDVVVTGDRARLALFSEALNGSRTLASSREFELVAGTYWGTEVCACSTGIGAPAMAIAVEELARAGARRIVRLGTCGAMRRGIGLGDLVVPTAAVRDEGTTARYVVKGFPAAASPGLVGRLDSACPRGRPRHMGVVWSTDKFYLEPEELERWFGRVAAVEMECSALFVVTALRGLEAGALLVVDGNLAEGRPKECLERPDELDAAIRAAVAAVLEALTKGR